MVANLKFRTLVVCLKRSRHTGKNRIRLLKKQPNQDIPCSDILTSSLKFDLFLNINYGNYSKNSNNS